MKTKRDVIGLIPAAGKASRISPLPCSKELFPVGFRYVENSNTLRPKVVSHYLLEKMRIANVTKAYIILRKGKWDIPSYYGDGKLLDMHLAYLIMDLPYGVPFTLDQAYPFVKDSMIALGFPDMIFYPDDAFIELLAKQEEAGSDIVLGLFPAHKPHKTDMIELDEEGTAQMIHIKPDSTQLLYAWEIAVWTPVFTSFMHKYVVSMQEKYRINKPGTSGESAELHVGDVIQAAIKDKMRIDSVLFKEGKCLDIGTPEDLMDALHANLAKANQGD
ncbi:MAG: sugar phosphate nucleotidyltransferase [Candidatus Loosdrechtia sp.]|uniref:sugar phosphate nucleotidyltransferase n=1 Tax=Candidatus Loosdrechtia sp. TaxID=3101272 RepID=UPI003A74927E|nr:MAG: sugar phosphate nucleotidyltransferase [Candidatus Jettenia sp. AMX2]